MHRWAHEWEPLWRFHAVHHAPHKLYWLNVGRFHPIDKGLQVFLDTLPFLLLGVGEDVLALYVVCYAINGFFQHCNIDVRLGNTPWMRAIKIASCTISRSVGFLRVNLWTISFVSFSAIVFYAPRPT